MKIIHVNTSAAGGAAKAAIRLREGLGQANLSAQMLVLYREDHPDKHIHSFYPAVQPLYKKAFQALRYRSDALIKTHRSPAPNQPYEAFSFPDTIYDLSRHPLVKEADIVHLHWVGNFLDYTSFFKRINKPVVWTLHDLNPFSGGFHYEQDFRNNHLNFFRLHQKNLAVKRQSLRQFKNLTVVSPSRWMFQQASNSAVLGRFRQVHIPNGINLDIFKKINQTAARTLLDIPLDKKVLLFIADSVHNKRKGFQLLLETLGLIHDKDLLLVIVGKGEVGNTSIPVKKINFILDDRLLAAIYSAADLCVVPSLEDNLPNTILESMACETPVLGFDTGGIPDIVRPYKTGLLAKTKQVKDLAKKITYLLDDEEIRGFLGENARRVVQQEYNIVKQTQQYAALYHHILGKSFSPKTFNEELTKVWPNFI